MSELLAIGCALLIVIAIGPLVLLLCLWLVGDRLGRGVASRLLDAAGGAVDVAMVGRKLVNMIGGTALAALGVSMAFHDAQMTHKAAALLILVPGGLWRAWCGFVIFRSRNSQ